LECSNAIVRVASRGGKQVSEQTAIALGRAEGTAGLPAGSHSDRAALYLATQTRSGFAAGQPIHSLHSSGVSAAAAAQEERA
jgi:hypothetical protein